VKKLISIVVLLLILASGLWAGATYWFGVEAEQRYHALLQQASEVQYFKFANESYSRGFFESKAQTVMEIQLPSTADGKNQPIKISLAHDITHGPFPLSKSPEGNLQLKPLMAIIETRVVVGPEFRSHLEELYGQVPEIESMRDYTLIYLDGSGEENFAIPAFQRSFGKEEKVAVDWRGLFLQFNFTPDLKGFTGSLSIPGLEIAGKNGELKIEQLKSTFDTHEGIGGLSLGEASFSLDAVEFADRQEAEPTTFLMRGFNANASSKASGDTVNCFLAIRTDQLKLDDEMQYGPGGFEMAFRNIDALSLARLQQTVRETQAQFPQESAEQMQMMMLAKYGEILPGLLKKSPELEITQLSIKTADGDFVGQANITIDGTKAGPTQDLLMLINAITAQVELKVGERLLHRVAKTAMKDEIIAQKIERDGVAPSDPEISATASAMLNEQLQGLMALGLLVEEDENYSAQASYKAGEVVLNGRPMSLQDLMR